MSLWRCLSILSLILLCVSSAPTTKKDEGSNNVEGLPLLLEETMFDTNNGAQEEKEKEVEIPILHEEKVEIVKDDGDDDNVDPAIVATNQEEGDDDSAYYSEYDSLPSWYVDQLQAEVKDNQTTTVGYQEYKAELDQLILDVKLYQIYHSIKTLKGVLDDLLQEDDEEEKVDVRRKHDEEEAKEEAEEKETSGGGEVHSLKSLKDRETAIAKQLGALKQDRKERSPRRIKRDLGFEDDNKRDTRASRWNDGKPNLQWMVKYDETNYDDYPDLSQADDGLAPANEFDLTKDPIQDVLSKFFPSASLDDNLLPGNEININVGDQSLSQHIWYPSKRGLRRSSTDSNFLARLPTLEGMRKRRRTYIPLRRSRNEKSILDRYLDADITGSNDREMFIRRQVANLARRLAQNTRRSNGMTPSIRDFTNWPTGDVNMWFENNPMYNIGVDENVGDAFGWIDVDLPRSSPDRVAELHHTAGIRSELRHLPTSRLQRRSRIVEEPSLPGPYQGYFMEGQLWNELFSKRTAQSPALQGLKPKNLKIGGPNAWGNFIFINDKGVLPSDGEWLSQSFGDNIGNNGGPPIEIETEGMWDDGDDEPSNEESEELTEQEKEWIRRIIGFEES